MNTERKGLGHAIPSTCEGSEDAVGCVAWTHFAAIRALVSSWLVVFAVAACSTMGWQHYEQATQVEHASKNFKVTLPADWVRYNQAQRDVIVVTRDGLRVQQIMAAHAPHDKAFDKIKKKSAETMLPAELAELQIAEMKALGNLSNLEVLENAPAKLGAMPAFHALTQFKNNDGLAINIEMLGAVNAKGYYLLQYQAPALHFFERDRAAFRNVVESFLAQ
jgi:hypothetical protein